MRLDIRTCRISAISFAGVFDQLSDLCFSHFFRFCCHEIFCLVPIPAWMQDKNKAKSNGYDVTLLFQTYVDLRRLAPSDLCVDMGHVFKKLASQLSDIYCDVLHFFMTARSVPLTSHIPSACLPTRAERFANGVFPKKNCTENWVAFIGETVICIAPPCFHDMLQRLAYNGEKRKHAL